MNPQTRWNNLYTLVLVGTHNGIKKSVRANVCPSVNSSERVRLGKVLKLTRQKTPTHLV